MSSDAKKAGRRVQQKIMRHSRTILLGMKHVMKRGTFVFNPV